MNRIPKDPADLPDAMRSVGFGGRNILTDPSTSDVIDQRWRGGATCPEIQADRTDSTLQIEVTH